MSTMSNIDIHKKAYYSVIEPELVESLHEKVSEFLQDKVSSQNYSWSHARYLDHWRELKLHVKITYSSHRVLRRLYLYWGLTYTRGLHMIIQ